MTAKVDDPPAAAPVPEGYARADAAGNPSIRPIPEGFIRPAHGAGLLRAPFTSEQARAAQARRGADLWHEAQKMCRVRSPESVRNLIRLEASDDDRVSLMASEKIMTWAWGAPKQFDPRELADAAAKLDFTKIPAQHLHVILEICRMGIVAPPQDEAAQPSDAQHDAQSSSGSDAAAAPHNIIDGTATATEEPALSFVRSRQAADARG